MKLDALPAGLGELTYAQKRELIGRVAASAQFRRALRLREFLLFVGRTSLIEGSPEVHEQDIGVNVFGRSPEYDRGADGIVRVNATELRKRIDHYFANEGIGESIIFQIPRGGYTPVFTPRIVDTAEEEQAVHIDREPQTAMSVAPSKSGRGWMWLSVTLSCLCLVMTGALYRARTSAVESGDRALVMQFWRGFTHDRDPNAQTDLVLPDESVSLMEDMLRRPVSLPDYMDSSYKDDVDTSFASSDRKADVREILQHNLVTFGSLMAARQMLMLPGLAQHFHVTIPRNYPPDMMKRNNLVIVGGKKSNPWAGFFDGQLDFTLEYDTKTSQNFVFNHHPLPGEQTTFQPFVASNLTYGIAVLAYIRNPGNTGDVLLLTGSDSDGTAAAADFITSEPSFQKLLKRFGRSQLPHCEVVLRTSRLSGTSFNAEIVTSRLHE